MTEEHNNLRIKQLINASIDVKTRILNDEAIIDMIQKSTILITEAFRSGHKVLFCGNGGSAADAQHLAAEFSGRFYKDRRALPAEALHTNTSYLTAVANDYSYDVIYSRLIEGIGQPGDVLFLLSTSGNSQNIVNAALAARDRQMISIWLTGSKGGKLNGLCDHLIHVPSDDTPRIQEAHILIGHIICQMVESAYFGY
ncbi:MAG: D-sedoheptulose 7-phosphate isomerase [Chitinophagales bacterium]|nr:D-sedoheptulose 7-phosphate isomerase [Chitinophagales bacterium]